MKISENEILISYDENLKKIIIHRTVLGAGHTVNKALLTEITLEQLKENAFNETARLLGENILIFLKEREKIWIYRIKSKGSK